MKKNLKTILILLVLGGLVILAIQLNSSKENSSLSNEALSDFAVEDTANIDKIILSDTYGGEVRIKREGSVWVSEEAECIQQHLVQTMLETIRHIKVKGPVPKNAIETVNKNITVHHKKVEIYLKGELAKTWYIGNPTPDHYGTYMLLKDPVKGKSPEPFIMYLPTMHGSLKTRFITDPREFVCTNVFDYRPENIQSVSITYTDSAQNSFIIQALDQNKFQLYNGPNNVPHFDTASVRNYLLGYKKIHFEHPNYILDERQMDSLRKEKPQTIIDVTLKNGERNRVACYKKWMDYYKMDLDGTPLKWDRDRLWLVLNDGEVVVAQYYVFDRLLQKISLFRPRE
ncbi:MAG: hypothetical protein MK078_05555 [Crocinitomicaceae bacterium]|nr:hypothetical protein [Crocinitomicaceae bacterium]